MLNKLAENMRMNILLETTIVIEELSGRLRKIEPDGKGAWNVYSRFMEKWSWSDLIGKSAVIQHINNAQQVYSVQSIK